MSKLTDEQIWQIYNAIEQRINCFGVTSHGKEHGDWLVTISKKVN